MEAAIPQVLRDAILQHKKIDPGKIAKARAEFFAKWLKIAHDLKDDEAKIKDGMSKERQRILQPKRLLVWQAMLKEAGYADVGVVGETIIVTVLHLEYGTFSHCTETLSYSKCILARPRDVSYSK